jgi:hypothetical protein
MTVDEFSGPAFAEGVVRGARSWNVDKLGRLTGVTFKQVWRPGENTAECRAREDDFAYRVSTLLSYGRQVEVDLTPKAREAHSMVSCKCGFYGYYEGSNDYHSTDRVSGVVEGFGESIIGTRGFRVAKARIVALQIPRGFPDHLAKLVRRNYAEIPFFDSFEVMVGEFTPDAGGHEMTPDTDPEFWTRAL